MYVRTTLHDYRNAVDGPIGSGAVKHLKLILALREMSEHELASIPKADLAPGDEPVNSPRKQIDEQHLLSLA